MIPRYPTNKFLLLELVRQSKTSHALFNMEHKRIYVRFPIIMGNYKCTNVAKEVDLCEEELMMYKLELFTLQRINYDLEGNIAKGIAGKHAHVHHLEFF